MSVKLLYLYIYKCIYLSIYLSIDFYLILKDFTIMSVHFCFDVGYARVT